MQRLHGYKKRLNGVELGCGELFGLLKDTGEVRKLSQSMMMLLCTSCRCNMSRNWVFDPPTCPPNQGTGQSKWMERMYGCQTTFFSVALGCVELFGRFKHTGEVRKLIQSMMMLLFTNWRSNMSRNKLYLPTGSRYEVVRMDSTDERVPKHVFEQRCIWSWGIVWLV